ncbi:MAG: hypothetical protein WCA84_00915 [Ignavibacteriaceae bacterium]
MKLKIILAFLIILIFPIKNYSTDLTKNDLAKLRVLFYQSTKNEDSLDTLFTFLSVLSKKNDIKNNPLLIAYSGVGKALLARYTFFPWDKLRYVNDGFRLMDEAVELDDNNLEIRFLRFSVLTNIPPILGYTEKANKEANSLYLLLMSSNIMEDDKLIKNIAEFLILSKRLDQNKQKDLSQMFKIAIKQ